MLGLGARGQDPFYCKTDELSTESLAKVPPHSRFIVCRVLAWRNSTHHKHLRANRAPNGHPPLQPTWKGRGHSAHPAGEAPSGHGDGGLKDLRVGHHQCPRPLATQGLQGKPPALSRGALAPIRVLTPACGARASLLRNERLAVLASQGKGLRTEQVPH